MKISADTRFDGPCEVEIQCGGRLEEEKEKEEARSKKKDILSGNQLLLGDQALKRKWDDDTVRDLEDKDNRWLLEHAFKLTIM